MGILDFFFPRKCLGCGRVGAYFCGNCLNFLSLERQRICPVCERPAVGGQTHPGCLTNSSLNGLTAVFVYRGLVKSAIVKLKYRFVSDLAKDLVEAFLSFCGEDESFVRFCREQNVCLVPIPLHPRRHRWRGFNQSELLGRMITENLGINFCSDLLQRTRNTTPQTKLKEKERKKNIKGAFIINPNSKFIIHDSALMLFDDVWTTGATLKEAGRVLKQKGAKNVWGLTLAR